MDIGRSRTHISSAGGPGKRHVIYNVDDDIIISAGFGRRASVRRLKPNWDVGVMISRGQASREQLIAVPPACNAVQSTVALLREMEGGTNRNRITGTRKQQSMAEK